MSVIRALCCGGGRGLGSANRGMSLFGVVVAMWPVRPAVGACDFGLRVYRSA